MQIPTIDMSNGLDHPAVIQQLAQACQDWGFFQLTGHGLPRGLRDQLFEAMRQFFDLAHADKLNLSRTERNFWGYYDKELTKNKVDCKEIFDIDGNLSRLAAHPLQIHSAHRVPWPETLPAFKPVVLDWLQQSEILSKSILEAICIALEQSSNVLYPFFIQDHSSFLRFNYYPPASSRSKHTMIHADNLGIHPHTDAGALTVLAQDDVPGLQVRKNATWHTVDPVKESLIINIGDMIQVWSNDRFPAPEHRVLASDERARYSAPYFYNPSYETICQPLLNTTQSSGHGSIEKSKYRPIRWGEFRSGRAAGDYANLGEEVQISHYRANEMPV